MRILGMAMTALSLQLVLLAQDTGKAKADAEPPRIQRIHSGDLIDIRLWDRRFRVHLFGVDAPEPGQPLAEEARQYLVDLLKDEKPRLDNWRGGQIEAMRDMLTKLNDTVVTKVSFSDTPITTVFDFLQARSRLLDPKGKGVPFMVILKPAAQEPAMAKDETEDLVAEDEDDWNADKEWGEDAEDPWGPPGQGQPTLTMDFDNIPLGRLLHYICTASALRYRITSDLVIITDKDPDFSQIPAAFDVSIYLPANGYSANYLMLRQGLAWYHPPVDGNAGIPGEELAAAQKLAKEEKLGIWGLEKTPMPPWEYRRKQEQKESAAP